MNYLTMNQATRPATREMNNLLRDRFILAANDLKLAYFVSDHVYECRAAARTALNTWYAFMQKYHIFRTDKAYYWQRYTED